ncbi:MAG: ATP-dependent zinc metalloprotease FtsH [Saprospiraceae bacterium]|nr:ATP-dependent zinc metalloprotease FtsH [Bacteroidia bacterium]MBT8230396.1 ATP-dependent zinc metalloprotease FtsH [Bacteroidia bacterium]NNF20511.1 ATP-dependent zinc metalloprotease FtsH [Saprospiraceae bacterium]NNK89457.1 ATP-dependent zinc metalloprotease FtsH [Saprospiraceae bacterium]
MSEKNEDKNPKKFVLNSYWIYGLIIFFILALNIVTLINGKTSELTPYKFKDIATKGHVAKVDVINKNLVRVFIKKDSLVHYPEIKENNFNVQQPHFAFEIGDVASFVAMVNEINTTKGSVLIDPVYKTEQNYWGAVLSWVIPLFLIIGLWIFFMRRVGTGAGGPGAQIFNIGKSKATLFDNNAAVTVTFKDVAGLEEAKEEVMEVVDFLKNPKKYTSLGGKIPKGVLLVGPPGTGKTLLAKAVAGEAAVPFFSISGSDFVEMFVGVGASRVRDLFKQAREKAPCIVFIDEIDAIGRARGKGAIQGGNDERENTLNQLLVEMDGFSTDKGVILMAATNRPDILDNALLRPGRFDRQIGIDRPDLKGREAIFKVHLKTIKTSSEIDPYALAEMTPGFAGADIANVCNEAALVAARRNKSSVEMDDFNYALDRVIGGLEKKNKIISPRDKEIIAFHEAGHAICGWYLQHASPLVKVTIVPRGIGTLGYAQYLPKEEYITRTEQLKDRMIMTLGGRAAEKIVFDKISTGAQNDLDQVTKMAYSMISVFGMNKRVGNVSFYGMSQDSFSKPYSDETARLIDDEVRKLIDEQYLKAQELLKERRNELNVLAQQLLENEVLLKSDVERLIGPRPFPDVDDFHPTLNGGADSKYKELFEDEAENVEETIEE